MITIINSEDKRQKYLYELLKEKKLDVKLSNNETSAITILPIANFDVNKLNLKNVKIIIGGKYSNIKNVIYKSYINEEFEIKNSVLTAEGVIAKVINETEYKLMDSKIVVLGYGKTGKVIADKLKKLDAIPIIYTENENDKLCAKLLGYEVVDEIHNYDVLINTIPMKVIDESVLNKLNNECLIIDISSKPGGVDYAYCDLLNIKNFHFLGIPGKISPKSAAMIISEEILKILDDVNVR